MKTKATTKQQISKSEQVQAIQRVFDIMQLLAEHPKGLSLAQISQQSWLPRTTVQRIINTLQIEGTVEQLEDNRGRYRLGPLIAQFIHRNQTDVITFVRPYLQQLSQTFSETVIISNLSGIQINVIEQVVAEQVMRIVVPIGITKREVDHIGPDILLLLSYMPDDKLLELFLKEFINKKDAQWKAQQLLKQISQIRELKYVQIGGLAPPFQGISMIAVVLETYLGNYVLSIVAPTSRFEPRVEDFLTALMGVKQEIEIKIGS